MKSTRARLSVAEVLGCLRERDFVGKTGGMQNKIVPNALNIKKLMPELYEIWRKVWRRKTGQKARKSEISNTTFSCVVHVYAERRKYYDIAASYFWLLEVDKEYRTILNKEIKQKKVSDLAQPDSERFGKTFETIKEQLVQLMRKDENPRPWEIPDDSFETLRRLFQQDLDERYESLPKDARVAELIAFLDRSRKPRAEKKAEIITCYVVLALTHWHWDRSLPLLADYCSNNHFYDSKINSEKKTIAQQAQELFLSGKTEQADELLLEAKRREERNGYCDYLRAQLRRSELVGGSSSRNRRVICEEYRKALNESCDVLYPEALIERARQSIGGRTDSLFEGDLGQCLEDCQTLLAHAEEQKQSVLGEAYWLLFLLVKREYQVAIDFTKKYHLETAEQVLKRAAALNCREAIELLSKEEGKRSVSLTHTLKRSESAESGVAFASGSLNDVPINILDRTRPAHWALAPLAAEAIPNALADHPGKPIKFFLLSPDEMQNLKDALVILQMIKEAPHVNCENVRNIALYVRGNEERLSPIIDTAQEHMDGLITRVTVLDPEKNAVRWLLSRHPLFFPIRDTDALKKRSMLIEHPNAAAKKRRNYHYNLHFVIVGDSRRCEWLLREAFWMMTFRELTSLQIRIHSQITIIAPNAKSCLDRVLRACPGMAEAKSTDSPSSDSEKDILIKAVDLPYDGQEFTDTIADIFTERFTSCYFALDAGTDLENLQHAIHMREVLTRKWIQDGYERALESPVIAFHCADPDIANLSKETAVLNENLGAAWYNNYRLIPFGAETDLYSWNQLAANVQEDVGYCNHLQYYRLDVEGPGEKAEAVKKAEAWSDYFRRSYNRESSFEVALSMPYRFFNSGIAPKDWDILDADAFWSETALRAFSYIYDQKKDRVLNWLQMSRDDSYHKDDSYDKKYHLTGEYVMSQELSELAEWEHNRWNRYMISRGWVPSTVEQTLAYRQEGNGRWQLYIGKMHPAIAPFKNLAELELALKNGNKTDEKKPDFTQVDARNIRATGAILSRVWEREQEKEDSRE